MKDLPRYSKCFICGKDNPAGADITFIKTSEGVECEYNAPEKHMGYKNIIHGGVITALLDECAGWAVALKEKQMFMTGELNIKFLRPLKINTKVKVKGFTSSEIFENKKFKIGTGYIIDEIGRKYASVTGKYYPISKNREIEVLSYLEMNGSKEPVTEGDIWI